MCKKVWNTWNRHISIQPNKTKPIRADPNRIQSNTHAQSNQFIYLFIFLNFQPLHRILHYFGVTLMYVVKPKMLFELSSSTLLLFIDRLSCCFFKQMSKQNVRSFSKRIVSNESVTLNVMFSQNQPTLTCFWHFNLNPSDWNILFCWSWNGSISMIKHKYNCCWSKILPFYNHNERFFHQFQFGIFVFERQPDFGYLSA